MADIALSSAVRSNLLALQNTSGFIDRTQGRLSTGLAVANPSDDAVKFFQAKSLSDRATDLMERKSSIDQGVNALNAALTAVESIEDLVQQIKGVVDSARSADKTQRAAFQKQIGELGEQISKLVNDASYQGLNLLNSTASKLSVRFSEKTDSKLDVNGVDFSLSLFFKNSTGAAALGATKGSALLTHVFSSKLSKYNNSLATILASFNAKADAFVASMDSTISNLRAEAAKMAGNVAILEVRSNFTADYVGVLETGSGQLTLADLNEEGANLLALQTRQQMGIQALSFAGQSEQAVLGLFR
ncbi:flagellin [Terasakiella sp.]|jgi:flagellin-like hook-associated protein FlgL|uniref:flagellin N-terminal helical domain-containing protein n=1 Tax=Terasakiella sp. TaxID=2034861 RepID=UPI003AA7DF28